MRISPFLLSALASALLAQAPSPGGTPALKWRGSLWASAVTQNRDTGDSSLVFRPLEAGQGQFTLDGLMLGVDAALTGGWSAKATLLTGQAGKVVQGSTGDSGTIAPVEAMLVWTGEHDTFRAGRMITFIGMEFLDGAQDVAASRGLLFSFVDPFGQVGINWHHAFSPVWSADLWAFNGEDRTRDNNHGKTVGLGLTYNHAGSQENFLSLQAYSGVEQDGFGPASHTGAEGRKRERVCLMGQWIGGGSTFQWEASLGRESFGAASILGATAPATATWRGYGFICKQAITPSLGLFARAEWLSDDLGVRLSADPTIREGLGLAGPIAYAGRMGANLRAQAASIGVEQKYGPAFARLELRQDRLNRDLTDTQGRAFRENLSGTLSLGASF
ncbi:MAG: porin [Holophagaceae bacterium]|nr:porin [Holophagaceae bacterium]